MIDAILYLDSLTFPILNTDALMVSGFLVSMLVLTGTVLLLDKVNNVRKRLNY